MQPHELAMAFFLLNSDIFFLSSLASSVILLVVTRAWHRCAPVGGSFPQSGQRYKDNEVDLRKQSYLPAPDTAWQLMKAQGQIFQTLVW